MNPLYTEHGKQNPYYGVDPSCEHRILKSVIFSGRGHIEVRGPSIGTYVSKLKMYAYYTAGVFRDPF